jgi:hypothetical protein
MRELWYHPFTYRDARFRLCLMYLNLLVYHQLHHTIGIFFILEFMSCNDAAWLVWRGVSTVVSAATTVRTDQANFRPIFSNALNLKLDGR